MIWAVWAAACLGALSVCPLAVGLERSEIHRRCLVASLLGRQQSLREAMTDVFSAIDPS